MLAQPVRIAAARSPIATTLAQSIAIIRRRRSTLSTSTPPGRANSSHVSHATPKAAEMISGSLVRYATNRGVAMVARPLPRAEVVLAAHSFQNRAPSPAILSADIASDVPWPRTCLLRAVASCAAAADGFQERR